MAATMHEPETYEGTREKIGKIAAEGFARHELTDDQHRALAEVLRGAAGYVVLSGYACDLYDRELFPDWHWVERATHADGARDRIEVLWLSPRTREALRCAQGVLL